MIFHRMSSVFLYKRQKFSSAFLFCLKAAAVFSAQAERGAQTAHAVHPFRAAPFLHQLTWARELPQAGSPLTGGKFFAEPQQRNSPSADGGSGAPPAVGAKRKDNLRFSFLFELLPFPYSLVWRRFPTCDRFEKENGRGFLLPCLSLPIRSIRYRTATHTGYSTQARHKVNCPKGKRGSLGDTRAAQLAGSDILHGNCELHSLCHRVRRPRRTACIRSAQIIPQGRTLFAHAMVNPHGLARTKPVP